MLFPSSVGMLVCTKPACPARDGQVTHLWVCSVDCWEFLAEQQNESKRSSLCSHFPIVSFPEEPPDDGFIVPLPFFIYIHININTHIHSHIHIYNGRVQILVEKDSTLLGHDIPLMSWHDGRFELPNLYRIFIIIILISILFTSFSKLAHPKILCFVMAIVFHYFSHTHTHTYIMLW